MLNKENKSFHFLYIVARRNNVKTLTIKSCRHRS